jgi:hypothetical protein
MDSFDFEMDLKKSSEILTQSVQQANENYVKTVARKFEQLNEQNKSLLNENSRLKTELNNTKISLERKRAQLNASLSATHKENDSFMDRNRLNNEYHQKQIVNLEQDLLVEKDKNCRITDENKIIKRKCDDLLISNDYLKALHDELLKYSIKFISCFEEFTKNLRLSNIDCSDYSRGFSIQEKSIMYSKEFDVILNGIMRNDTVSKEKITKLEEQNKGLECKIEKLKKIFDEESDEDEIRGCKRQKRARIDKNKIIYDSDD